MSQNPTCLVNRFDHIEIATSNLSTMFALFENLGFTCTQKRETPQLKQELLVQGHSRILLSQGQPGTFAYDYARKHGDGVCSIAYHVEDAAETLKVALERGAILAQPVTQEKDDKLSVTTAAIASFGDVRATFVARSLAPFDVAATFAPGFIGTGKKPDTSEIGFRVLDHLTNNVEMGQMERWSDFYKKVFGWVEARYFDIRGSQTGLLSKVLQSPDGAVKIPINEASEKKSQIQEFIDLHKGAGVQHIAMTTSDIRKSVRELKKRGFRFLDIPEAYYEDVPKRVKNVVEPMAELKDLNILVDGDDKGYLLQIFTENQIGPLFFEVIQRRGNNGFGEGNFKALFESMERDQARRGVL